MYVPRMRYKFKCKIITSKKKAWYVKDKELLLYEYCRSYHTAVLYIVINYVQV